MPLIPLIDDSTIADATPTAFSSAPLSYRQLLERGIEYLTNAGLGRQQVKNLASALRLWIDIQGYSLERIVAEEFGADFDRAFLRFCDVLPEGRAVRTQKDRQEQILRWRRLAQALRQQDNLPQDFGAALAHCVRHSPLTRAQIARDVGLQLRQIDYWCSGRGQPRPDVVQVIPVLEKLLELPAGTLLSRLPLARRSRYLRGQSQPDRTTVFTKTRRAQMRIGPYAASFDGPLRDQWIELLAFKTDSFRDHARARNTWRIKSIERVAIHIHPWMLHGDKICPTAGVHWGFVASYLGWLSLPRPQGRDLSKESTKTLAWLSSSKDIIDYAKWVMSRSGNRFHNGINVILQLIESYLRPMTGFVWLHPELADSLPKHGLLSPQQAGESSLERNSRWQEKCTEARKKIREFRERAEDTLKIRPSRDPEERIACVLKDEFPLKRLVEFVQTLERSAPPPAHHRDYIAWIRDVTLCRMLMSNPIRVSQFASMTFREDGTGNLIRVAPGQYRLTFEPEDFKNAKGAANVPYEVSVDVSVAPWLDRYLSEARPNLVDADNTDRLFLAAAPGPRKVKPHLIEAGLVQEPGWTAEGIYARVKMLTSLYIPNCPGFGPHGYRHIVATDHLRRHPGDYLTVAMLLHDKLETVLKSYSHMKVGDGLRVLSAGIREATEQLNSKRTSA